MFRICQVRVNGVCRVPRRKKFTRLVPHMSSFSYLCRGKSCEYGERVSPERHQAYAGSKDKVFGNLTASPNTERSAISGFDTEQHAPLAPPKLLRGFRKRPSRTATCTILRIPPFTFPIVSRAPGLTWVWRGWTQTEKTAGTPLRSEPHDLSWI